MAVPTFTPMLDTAGAQGGAKAYSASATVTEDLAKDRMYTEFDLVDTIVMNNSGTSVANDDPIVKASGGVQIVGTGAKPFVSINDMRLLYYDNLLDFEGGNVADLGYVTTNTNNTYHQGYRIHFGERPIADPVFDPWGLNSGEMDLSCAIDGEDYNVFQRKDTWPANNVVGTNATIQTTSGRVCEQKGVQGLHNRNHINADGTPGPLWRTAMPFWWEEDVAPGSTTYSNLSFPYVITPGAFIREAVLMFLDNGVFPSDNRTDSYVTEMSLSLPFAGKVTPFYLPIHVAKFRTNMNKQNPISNGNNGSTPGSPVVGKASGIVKIDFRAITGDRRGLNMYKKVAGDVPQKGEIQWNFTIAVASGAIKILYKGWFPPSVAQPGNTIWNQPLPG